ncbi:MAG: hypothetical protein KBG48_13810 [Kofleriaceae bacterium]|jgi:hypothetical protein|nr:hypothetical protein [Kofleriaceae bacterium]MBP9168465.1 hypothetical protein [Kofleriaceae bacterium]MBP9858913.1 hypothetical protein [Kofleriaceae bacterium]
MPVALRSLVLVVALAVLGCGGRSTPRSGRAELYPAARFVPADATYAIAARSGDDLVRVLRDLADGLGPAVQVDAAALGALLAEELGLDLLSSAALVDAGVDLAGGVAVWGHGGVSPVLAVALADPARLAAHIDRLRQGGLVLATSTVDGHEVSTWRPERGLAIHWVAIDRYLLIHLELTGERATPDAWLRTALAAGGRFVEHPDLAAAVAAGASHLGLATPPVVGVIRPAQLRAAVLGEHLPACAALVAPVGRVFVAAASGADRQPSESRGVITVEVGAAAAGIAAAALPAPPGWAAARADAPLVVEWGLDLRRVEAAVEPCLGDALTRDATRAGLWGVRAFAHQLDLDDRAARGAIAAAAKPGVLDEALDEIPGRAIFARTRQVAGRTVTSVDVPLVPAFHAAQDGEAVTVAVDLPIDGLLDRVPSDDLVRVEVRPQAWSAESWDQLLEPIIGRDRARAVTVAALRRWTYGEVTARLTGDTLIVTLRGDR